uniref:Uncharacterized protein n=1 Tax=Rhodococcus sp. NS1 TaxID=402236 RepID=A0A097SQT2_9NOCA|nr:hypothetical protein LRS1606.457 [Rhodococcus sp. NS1]
MSTAQIGTTEESFPMDVDVIDDHRSRRSTSAAAKNALAVFKISLALRSSAFSSRRRRSSSTSGSSLAIDAVGESFRSAASIQFRSVAGAMSSSSPTWRRAAIFGPPCSRIRSRYIRTARSWVSASYFLGADIPAFSLLDQEPPPHPGRFKVAR